MLTRRQHVLLLLPLVIFLVPFLLAPALLGFLTSFTDYSPLEKSFDWVGLANYETVVGDPEFTAAYRNIALFTIIAVPAELILGFCLAYLLRKPFRGRGIVRILLLAPWLISPVANGVVWRFLLNNRTGLLNFGLGWLGMRLDASPLGLHGFGLPIIIATDIWRNAPLAAFLLLPGILAIPLDHWEQATLEGATVVHRIRHVVIPFVSSPLLTIGLLLIGATLGSFENVLVMTGGGPGTETTTPGLISYQQAYHLNSWSVGATGAWLIAGIVLAMSMVYLRLVRTAGES